MKTFEIKKVLYKENPIAERLYNEDNNVIYGCDSSIGRIIFCVPSIEATYFKTKEPAQLLIRWLTQ